VTAPTLEIEWVQVLDFVVHGEPVAKGRPRFAPPFRNVVLAWARGGGKGPAPRGHVHTPAETIKYERDVQIACQRAMTVHRLVPLPPGVPIRLEVVLVHPRRKSDIKKCRARTRMLKYTKPDADNEVKALCDGMEKAGLFPNDSQITDLLVRKRWASMDDSLQCEAPHARVVVSIPRQETP